MARRRARATRARAPAVACSRATERMVVPQGMQMRARRELCAPVGATGPQAIRRLEFCAFRNDSFFLCVSFCRRDARVALFSVLSFETPSFGKLSYVISRDQGAQQHL